MSFCKALGDETRQQILETLLQRGETCVSDLVNTFHLSQPTISHHLTLLKNANLVTSRKKGKQVFYAIDEETMVLCCNGLISKFIRNYSAAPTGLSEKEANFSESWPL
ncbi:MAG: winged helix-turn-helix transcriptional regulator [Chloroflexi bacterium]|nr:winged helix-turn-helix transcriptional regulator [Chloroflexota bacterium]